MVSIFSRGCKLPHQSSPFLLASLAGVVYRPTPLRNYYGRSSSTYTPNPPCHPLPSLPHLSGSLARGSMLPLSPLLGTLAGVVCSPLRIISRGSIVEGWLYINPGWYSTCGGMTINVPLMKWRLYTSCRVYIFYGVRYSTKYTVFFLLLLTINLLRYFYYTLVRLSL